VEAAIEALVRVDVRGACDRERAVWEEEDSCKSRAKGADLDTGDAFIRNSALRMVEGKNSPEHAVRPSGIEHPRDGAALLLTVGAT
jgi:hypothetical protein